MRSPTICLFLVLLLCSCGKRLYQSRSYVSIKKTEIQAFKRPSIIDFSRKDPPVVEIGKVNAVVDTAECDHLIMKDGREIDGIIVSIGEDKIEYRRCDYKEGPLYVVKSENVLFVRLKNGEKHIPTTKVPEPLKEVTPQKLPPGPNIVGFVMSIVASILTSLAWAGIGGIIMLVVAGIFSLASVGISASGTKHRLNGLGMAGVIIGMLAVIACIAAILVLFVL